MRLVDWIRLVIEHRQAAAIDKAAAIEAGLKESLLAGTTTLGEIATAGWSPEKFEHSPLHATLFYELIGPAADRVGPCLELADDHLRLQSHERLTYGLSPHAPYTVHPDLLAGAVEHCRLSGAPLAMHLAESPEELELLQTGRGPIADLLQERSAWDPRAIRAPRRPLDYLEQLALAPRVLVIHGNYLDAQERAYVASRAPAMSLVYCPRTHAYFGHPRYPLAELLAAGANVALGTDSRASNPDLSVLAEMQFVAREHANVPGSSVLELGTLAGARALGADNETGSVTPGRRADLTLVSLPGHQAADPHELLWDVRACLAGVYVGGKEDPTGAANRLRSICTAATPPELSGKTVSPR
jgi:cytosine/adenosine deaminase-related metal-dependent hydrolase